MPAIGIDLGTTFSCVAVWQRGQVEIIPNAQGARTTPSYVSFKGNERLIGEAAKRRGDVCPKNTVFDAKRLIGRKFDDPQIQDDIKQWPFEIINKRGTPKIEVEFCDEKRQFYPEEISSMVLTEMKEIAEAFLGEPVKDAVITVPAYFNDSQRQATKDAGKIAGLNVHRIINEPTAAALAYGLDKNIQNEKKVLIFDFGGGTTDVSILNIKKGSSFEVLSTVGNLHLGGEDFDGKLVDFFCNEFEMEHGINIRTNAKALRKLRTAAENSKQELSSSTETSVVVDALADGIDFDIQLSRARFENICAKLFEEAFNPVRQALAQAHLDKMAIDDVVLVGGSTRMPKIKSMLKDFFCGKQLNCSINPDEAVAYGAAVQAFMLTDEGKTSSTLKNVRLLDVTPLSLGVRVKEQEFTGRTMAKVVPRNTMIPCNYTEVFTTVKDNQTCISIMVYEGEEQLVCKNNLLGQFHLSGIAPAPAGVPKIDMTFDIDVDGILHVTARDRESGRRNDIKITNDKGRLSETDINRMMEENELCRQNDINRNDKIGAKNKLQKYIYSMMENVQDNTSVQLSMNDKHKIKTICREAEVWIRDNPLADKQDYDNKLKQVENMCTWMFVKRPSHGSSCHQDHQDKKRRV